MKLLFDQNLSPGLINRLSDLYPGSSHVFLIGLDRAEDHLVWTYASNNDAIIVTKDSDYNDLSVIRGSPPKIVWIRRGNCSTSEIEDILRRHYEDITELYQNPNIGVITLF